MNFWPFSKKAEPIPIVAPPEPVVPEVVEEETTGNLTIKAITYDEKSERIRIDMDWDDEFVIYLKRNGFTGTTDEAIVQKYVATLYRNLMDDMNAGGKAYE